MKSRVVAWMILDKDVRITGIKVLQLFLRGPKNISSTEHGCHCVTIKW